MRNRCACSLGIVALTSFAEFTAMIDASPIRRCHVCRRLGMTAGSAASSGVAPSL